MDEHTHTQVVKAAQAGDRGAYERLYRAHKDAVYSLAMHFLRDGDAAADVTQETFVRAWAQLPRLREASAFGGWVRTMAMNLVRDHYRRGRDSEPLDEAMPVASGDAGPDEESLRRAQDRAVRDAVLGLPEHQRIPVVMHYLEGRPVAEVADILGVPRNTVISRLARGREALRRRLGPYIDQAGEP
jgi:RNA polymerase sigma-70 factor (ECF subfamily)